MGNTARKLEYREGDRAWRLWCGLTCWAWDVTGKSGWTVVAVKSIQGELLSSTWVVG